jgi:hypothetical protein
LLFLCLFVLVSFLAIVVLGCLHGLVFLPVLLSLVGPPSLSKKRGWRSFFGVTDARGLDDGRWAKGAGSEVEQTTPSAAASSSSSAGASSRRVANLNDDTGATQPAAVITKHVYRTTEFQPFAPFQ